MNVEMFNPLFIIESVGYTVPPVGSPVAEKNHMVSTCFHHTKNEQYKTSNQFAKH